MPPALPPEPSPEEILMPEEHMRRIEDVVMLAREQAQGAAAHCEEIWVRLIPQYRAALQATRPPS
jgi:hypothetical protein